MKHRTCTMCGQTYPATHKYFAWAIKSKGKLQARCRPCQSIMYKIRRPPADDIRAHVAEPKQPIVREKTDHGTVIVRFGDGWHPTSLPRRRSVWSGYQSVFE